MIFPRRTGARYPDPCTPFRGGPDRRFRRVVPAGKHPMTVRPIAAVVLFCGRWLPERYPAPWGRIRPNQGAYAAVMQLISDLAAIIAPAFLISFAGYLWARRGLPFDQIMITELMTLIGAPCLVFSIFTKMTLPVADVAVMGMASLACLVIFALTGAAGLRLAGLDVKVYLPSLIFPNVGNMGLPVCLFAFGDQGMALAMVYFAVTVIGQFTIGPAVAAGRLDLRSLLRLPFVYVAVVAVFLKIRGIDPPAWIANTASLAGGITVPMMLMALGVALAQLRVGNWWRAATMSLLRLGCGAAGGFLIALLFGLEGPARGVLIIQSAMPVAVFNYLFAYQYGNRPEEVAGMVLLSTAFAYIGLPVLVAILT